MISFKSLIEDLVYKESSYILNGFIIDIKVYSLLD